MDFSTRPLIKTRFAPVSGFRNKGSMRMPFKMAAIAVALTAVLALLAGALGYSMGLEAGRRIALNEKVKLIPRA